MVLLDVSWLMLIAWYIINKHIFNGPTAVITGCIILQLIDYTTEIIIDKIKEK